MRRSPVEIMIFSYMLKPEKPLSVPQHHHLLLFDIVELGHKDGQYSEKQLSKVDLWHPYRYTDMHVYDNTMTPPLNISRIHSVFLQYTFLVLLCILEQRFLGVGGRILTLSEDV